MLPLISLIITTKNEAAVLGRLLQSVKKQKYKKLELIIVDNRSQDDTKAIAKFYTNKVYNFGPERSAQRNLGAKKSKGNYLFFLDADMQLTKGVISECIMVIEKSKDIGAVVIPEVSVAKEFWEKVKAFERSVYNENGDPTTDAARFFRREVFFKVGGYEEEITGPEDWDLSETINKSGYKIERIKSKIYHHERIGSLLDLAKKKFYYGFNVYKYLKKHQIPTFGPKTIYFLRPVFYKNWHRLITHPVLSLSLFFLLFLEQISGGLGYILGRINKQ